MTQTVKESEVSTPKALDLIHPADRLTIGFELPLDNDISPSGRQRRWSDGRPPGVPDLSRMTERVQAAEALGFAAIWVRDVPVFDTKNMGDAGSVYDLFTLVGYLAGVTERIAIGTAAVALPLRHPLMTAKAAASADVLSDGRLLLGVASGDRPVEYPILGLDFERRGETFREAVDAIRAIWQPGGLPVNGIRHHDFDVLPRPLQDPIPLIVAGQARQSDAWLGQNMAGRFTYPMSIEATAQKARNWAEATGGTGAFLSAFYLDLLEDPDAPFAPTRMGGRSGRTALVEHFSRLHDAGVDHIAINLRQGDRPVEEVMHELGTEVLPALRQ